MEGAPGPATGRQGPSRGLFWGLIIAVVVLAAAGFAAVLYLWTSEEPVTVPDLVGLEEAEARGVLTGLGLELGDVERVPVEAGAAEPGTVLSQLPSAGSEVDAGSEVALVVAEEPEEEASEGDEEETAPADSSGGSGAEKEPGTDAEPKAQPEVEPEVKPEAKPEAKETWHTVASASGTLSHESPGFTISSTQVQLTVTLSSPPGGEFFVMLDSVGSAHWSVGHFNGTPTPSTYTRVNSSIEPAEYCMVIGMATSGSWSYELQEWR